MDWQQPVTASTIVLVMEVQHRAMEFTQDAMEAGAGTCGWCFTGRVCCLKVVFLVLLRGDQTEQSTSQWCFRRDKTFCLWHLAGAKAQA